MSKFQQSNVVSSALAGRFLLSTGVAFDAPSNSSASTDAFPRFTRDAAFPSVGINRRRVRKGALRSNVGV